MDKVHAPAAEKPKVEPERPPERRREHEPLGAVTAPLAGIAGAAWPGSAPSSQAAAFRQAGGPGAGLLALQRSLGNRHVQRVIALAREDFAMPGGGEVPAEVESAIQRSRGAGQALDSGLRARFEPAFGADFGGVRVHTGAEADRLNRDLSARAFTTGGDIFFRQGEYNPGSSSGRELLAHELTHVVQQGGAAAVQGKLTVGPVDDPFEREADRVARAVIAGMDGEREEEAAAAGIQRMPASAVLRRAPAQSPGGTPVVISGATFEDVAAAFSWTLQDRGVTEEKLAQVLLIVVNGGNVRLFDGKGTAASEETFRFKAPVDLPAGVFVTGPERRLHGVLQGAQGEWTMTGGSIVGKVDFARDLDDQEGFDQVAARFEGGYYIVPRVDLPEAPLERDEDIYDEEKPDFLKIEATGKAGRRAWPAAVIPITSPVTSVGSIGTFVCRLDKYDPWANPIANVTNNMEPMAFAWEVLELGDRLTVQGKDTATRWKGVAAGYEVRARHLEDDEKTRLGDSKDQGIPEKVFRAAFNEQIKDTRAILGYAGQTVLTVVKTFAGQPDNPRIEDIIDYKFDKPGNYFVRCLASSLAPVPEGGKRRATSVAGVMVSVFDIAALASGAVETAEDERKRSESRVLGFKAQLEELEAVRAGNDPAALAQHPYLDYEIWKAGQGILYEEKLAKAAGDAHARILLEIDFLRLQIERLTGPDAPRPSRAEHQKELAAAVEGMRKRVKALEDQAGRADARLGGATRTGTMPAVLVDDTTGSRIPLLFSIGEHSRINADELEVVIADITGEKGRVFTGIGSGWQGAGRAEAWTLALRDLRRNLGHGRGWLAFRAPEPYASLAGAAVENPMQLQVAELDQLKETVDDAAHALTLAALIAAPFTGGASLSVLAVLAPISAGSSLYNIVNRALYDDLHLDAEAIGDIANIATLGLARIGPAGQLATRGARIFATGGRIALQVFDQGQMVVLAWSTWEELTRPEEPGTDPREAQRRKIMALLSLLEAGAIPVASHLWPGGARPKPAEMPQRPWLASGPETAGARPAGTESQAPVRPGDEGAVKTGEGTRPAAPEILAVKAVPDALLEVLPPDVQRNAPPVINPDLAAGTVHVAYEIDPSTGVVKSLRLEIGPGTSPDRVAAHVETARTMARYQGLSGRARILYDQISAWIQGNPAAVPGTRAWEARLEVKKLGVLILRRTKEYQNADPAVQEQLRKELDDLNSQLLQHASEVDYYDIEGLGFVAVESQSKGAQKAREMKLPEPETGYFWVWKGGQLEYRSRNPAKYPKRRWYPEKKAFDWDLGNQDDNPVFEATTPRGALDELGAYDYTPGEAGQPAQMSEMRRFIELLIQEGFLGKPDDLIPYVPEFKGLRHRGVRHKIKEPFQERLLDRATDAKRLRTLPAYDAAIKAGADPAVALRAAAHQELLRISEGLPSSDRGSFGESWYERIYPPADPKTSYTQVEVTPEQINPQLPKDVAGWEGNRRIDSLRNQAVFEIKNISGPLSAHGRGQIEDMALLLGRNVLVPGDPPTGKTMGPPVPKQVQVQELVVVFPDPAGATANARWAASLLELHANRAIRIEVHNSRGETVRVSANKRGWLTAHPGGLQDWLAGTGKGP